MKKQRTKGIVLVVVCFICVMCICSGFHKAQSEELSEIPDAVNSTRFNTTEHLTVVANQEEIADKKELAKQIIKMCRESSLMIWYVRQNYRSMYIRRKTTLTIISNSVR